MEQKIATSIEQSKKLLKLGLDPKTADCYWEYDLTFKSYYPMFMDNQFDELCVPSWSLSALLELMPQEILINGFPTRLHIEKTKLGYSFEYIDTMGHAQCFVSFPLIEGACEMVCWLLEQGYIKKGGEK